MPHDPRGADASRSENRLARESSPYLLQHRSNPVDWYPWGEEAFAKARAENKPVLLSVGYSACHWCHVMAHESFEDETTARLMNDLFVNVKVDREERPDVDAVYMDAVQAMVRQGGWPLTAFLTPDRKPFYGGTYFPLEARSGRPSFRDVLTACARYFREEGEEVEKRARELVAALESAGSDQGLAALETAWDDRALTCESIAAKLAAVAVKAEEQLALEADRVNGGFGRAPKFLQPSKVEMLLGSESSVNVAHAILTLQKVRAGGLTDQVGFGLARYSVDPVWLVPHFEKMLYDNAQALPLFAQAAAVLEEANPALSTSLARAAENTVEYLERDLRDADSGLFCCAEDADSEGEEGLFYVFHDDEFEEALGSIGAAGGSSAAAELEFARRYFGVTARGNFEGANILTVPERPEAFAAKEGLTLEETLARAEACRQKLFAFRSRRERPERDSKCLLGWNALLASGYLRAGTMLVREDWVRKGLELIDTCFARFVSDGEGFKHTYTKGHAHIDAFADDIAFLFEACAEALCLTGAEAFLRQALVLAKTMHGTFVDPVKGSLYSTPRSSELLFRPHRPEDNVVPSAHASVIAACGMLRVFSDAQMDRPISASDAKMLEALALVALADVATLAQTTPLACARSLQWVTWMQTQASVVVKPEGESEKDARPSFADVCRPARVNAQGRRGRVVTCVPFRKGVSMATAAQESRAAADTKVRVTFGYCDMKGCQLPTPNYE